MWRVIRETVPMFIWFPQKAVIFKMHKCFAAQKHTEHRLSLYLYIYIKYTHFFCGILKFLFIDVSAKVFTLSFITYFHTALLSKIVHETRFLNSLHSPATISLNACRVDLVHTLIASGEVVLVWLGWGCLWVNAEKLHQSFLHTWLFERWTMCLKTLL